MDGFHKQQVTVQNIGTITFNLKKRYQLKEIIGKGAQGSVALATDLLTGQDVAIKKIIDPLRDGHTSKHTHREIAVMWAADHINIVKLLDVFSPDEASYNSQQSFTSSSLSSSTSSSSSSSNHKPKNLKEVYLVMDLMESDMQRLIVSGIQDLDHDRLSFLMYQLLCGVKNLHSVGIIHRDLKPANIVVASDCTLKITDFGLARKLNEDSDEQNLIYTPRIGTRYYKSPEVILGLGYSASTDIWSLGCIFAELLSGRILFKGRDDREQFIIITRLLGSPDNNFFNIVRNSRCPGALNFIQTMCNNRSISSKEKNQIIEQLIPNSSFPNEIPEDPRLSPENARDLLSKMLCINPEERITIDQALMHDYVVAWFDEDETVNATLPNLDVLDLREGKEVISLKDYEQLIFKQMRDFKRQQQN